MVVHFFSARAMFPAWANESNATYSDCCSHMLANNWGVILRSRKTREVLRSAWSYVCLSVCLLSYLKNHTTKRACCLRSQLDAPLATIKLCYVLPVSWWRHVFTQCGIAYHRTGCNFCKARSEARNKFIVYSQGNASYLILSSYTTAANRIPRAKSVIYDYLIAGYYAAK